MDQRFAKRVRDTQKSFLQRVFKAAADPEMISFAGGFPHKKFFPVEELKEATVRMLDEHGAEALQYSIAEGYLPLREWIAQRYHEKYRITVEPDEILITNGSQQGIDLISRVMLDEGDPLSIESPGYLGALDAFSLYLPRYHAVSMEDDGVNTDMLKQILKKTDVKLFYGVPNFQNPTGITYSEKKRNEVAEIVGSSKTLFVEDDPYGELRFMGDSLFPIKKLIGDRCVLLGSFSKIVAPSLRLGWMCADRHIMKRLVNAKHALDLHTANFTQLIVYRYLVDNNIDDHLETKRVAYLRQRNRMLEMIEEHFPKRVSFTRPEGGLFLWVTLPEGVSSLELFEIAEGKRVLFVPGTPFYPDASGGQNTLRLNFSNTDEKLIETGIKRLAEAMHEMIRKL